MSNTHYEQLLSLQRRVDEIGARIHRMTNREDLDWAERGNGAMLVRAADIVWSKLERYRDPKHSARLIIVSNSKAAELRKAAVAALVSELGLNEADADRAVDDVCQDLRTATMRAPHEPTLMARITVTPREAPRLSGQHDGIAALQAELIRAGNITVGQAGAVRMVAEKDGVPAARKLFSAFCALEPEAAFTHLQTLTDEIATAEGLPRYEAAFRSIERFPALARQAHQLSNVRGGRDLQAQEAHVAEVNKRANAAYVKLSDMAKARIDQKMRDNPEMYRTRHEAFASALDDVRREQPELAQVALGEERWTS